MPRIGLLSDSHGRSTTTRHGVDLLVSRGADRLVHLGDVGTVQVIDSLVVERPIAAGEAGAALGQIEVDLVFGNTDVDAAALAKYARGLGIVVHGRAGRIALEEGELVFCHGHEADVLAQALAQDVRYLCHGHTHRVSDTRQGRTRIINPGALFRARQYTVALLDTARDHVEFYPVPDRG